MVIKTCDGDFKKGKSYWKFNKALLEDPVYCEGMRRVINEKKVEYAAMDYQVRWEFVKYEIRKFTMDYSKKRARDKRRLLVQNEDITKNYETKSRNEHMISDEVYMKAKHDIELYHLEKVKGNILRSKCQVYEEGEKSTSLFGGWKKRKL